MYTEVANEGQSTIDTRWVVTQSVKNRIKTAKARLVARCYQENSTGIRKDSPTCKRDMIQLVVMIAACHNWKIKKLNSMDCGN